MWILSWTLFDRNLPAVRQHCFNVYLTLNGRHGRQMDVILTLPARRLFLQCSYCSSMQIQFHQIIYWLKLTFRFKNILFVKQSFHQNKSGFKNEKIARISHQLTICQSKWNISLILVLKGIDTVIEYRREGFASDLLSFFCVCENMSANKHNFLGNDVILGELTLQLVNIPKSRILAENTGQISFHIILKPN